MGSYFVTLSYFKTSAHNIGDLTSVADSVDLVLGQDSIFDQSPSVQDEIAGSSGAEVIIGPDADNLLK